MYLKSEVRFVCVLIYRQVDLTVLIHIFEKWVIKLKEIWIQFCKNADEINLFDEKNNEKLNEIKNVWSFSVKKCFKKIIANANCEYRHRAFERNVISMATRNTIKKTAIHSKLGENVCVIVCVSNTWKCVLMLHSTLLSNGICTKISIQFGISRHWLSTAYKQSNSLSVSLSFLSCSKNVKKELNCQRDQIQLKFTNRIRSKKKF